ncbi:M14 family zinc carboxypeptidase [Qipengyuania sp. MTN3-11]|uniref:M14 family zinc carboxypeptidase n=1 Tax=Qipengyuania sp. MTN3-11 TaxID=3056557 RepID=UPI0036F2494B
MGLGNRFWGSVRAAFTATMASALAVTAFAQSPLPGNFDPEIPSLEQSLGHATGTRISSADEIARYLEVLAQAAPDRTRLVQYATSWEGRPLHYLVISAPANMARLEANKAAMARIAAGEPGAPLDGVLPVTWLAYGVHGDEISSSDAALALAYHLLAARGDERVDTVLSNSIVVIDPSQNPDGRARFVQHYRTAAGLEPSPDRHAAEHDQQWPGGRFNHYLFDLNRDWFALTQPETRGKVAAVRDWNPVVLVDAHEMGGDSTFYFPPAAEPFNPNITAGQRDKQALLGRGVAAWFDDLGVDYYTREIFDAFYPGYGDTWPTLQGAVAATFEQSSARGLVWGRPDGTELTYAEGVRNHMVASLSYAETVARNADRFLADYAQYRRSAASSGSGSYLIDLSQRRWNAEILGRRLAYQGIAVERLGPGFSACGRSYPEGALAVPQNQPAGRLVRALLDRSTPLPPDFVARQEARRDRGQPHELYDTTAWSVGLMAGVDVALCGSTPAGSVLAADGPLADRAQPAGRYGLAVPWSDSGQAQLVLAALREGLTARAAGEEFTAAGRRFPRGTVVFRTNGNGAEKMARLTALAREIGAETVPLEESWIVDGPSIGSDRFAALSAPRVAMAWDDGVSPLSAGAWRYVVERRLATPVTPIRTDTLPSADLAAYDVLILPEARLDKPAAMAVKRYVQSGGVAVVVGAGTEDFFEGGARLFATGAENTLGEVETEKESEGSGGEKDDAGNEETAAAAIASEAEYREAIADTGAPPDTLPGALLATVADPDHYLTSGYGAGNGGAPVVHADGGTILAPLNEADGVNVLRFAAPGDLVASGYVWEENRAQMAFKPYLIAQPNGEGMAIGFVHDPATRGYLDGLDLLIANAILFAPARH